MKKVTTSLLTLLFIGISSFAQEGDIKDADKFFKQKKFEEAAEIYLEVEDKDKEILQNLADAYYYLNQMEEAETYYGQLFQEHEDGIGPDYKFRYAQTLRILDRHEEADEMFSEYFGEDINFQKWKEKVDSLSRYTYKATELLEGESSSNFGVSFMDQNRVVFASTRNEDRPKYDWNDQPYLDLYTATYSNNNLSEIKLLPGEVNTDTHESSATFNEEGTVMYFDRTNADRVKDEEEDTRVAHISIHRAELVDGEWTYVEELPFTSKNYTTEHPSLSADGTRLYFSSDMPGSMGSYDIFVVEVREDGSFGEPQNLGAAVNTAKREQFPFISEENILYFSSNGRVGFGKLDIFRSEKSDDSFSEAQNLGATINSSHDDFAYTMDQEGEKGFFTSTRGGTDNLYSFTRKKKPEPSVAPEEIVETNVRTGAQQLRDISDIYFDFDKAVILPKAEVALEKVIGIMEKYPKLRIEIGSHADIRGTAEYNMELSERRAQATLEYILSRGIERDRITAKGYGETMPLSECSEEGHDCSEEDHAINRRSEFKVMN